LVEVFPPNTMPVTTRAAIAAVPTASHRLLLLVLDFFLEPARRFRWL
jgi:hypothetical protein